MTSRPEATLRPVYIKTQKQKYWAQWLRLLSQHYGAGTQPGAQKETVPIGEKKYLFLGPGLSISANRKALFTSTELESVC